MSDTNRAPAVYRQNLFLARQLIAVLRDRALESGEPLHVGDLAFDAAALDALWDGLDRLDSHFWHMEKRWCKRRR